MSDTTGLDGALYDDGFDVSLLDTYDEAQLDDLPFGVICLDERGVILKYNLAEARLARLDRNRVLGKSFFRQIAPCTQTSDFEGRFRTLIAGGESRTSFRYLFDFKFGAQEVSIDMVRTASRRVYVCVNRTGFRAARPEFQDVAAPRQAELAPGEAAFGVRRDESDQRFVMLPTSALRALRMTWDKIAPQGWALFSNEWGSRWGRLAVLDIETELLETRGCTLDELPLTEALALLRIRFEQEGWGRLSFDVTSPAVTTRGAAWVTLERSALAEAAGQSDVPRCQLIAGVLRAMLGHTSKRVLAIREVRCAAQGAPCCEFLAVAHPRRAQLDEAVADATSVADALEQLDSRSGIAMTAGDVLSRLF